MLPLLKKTRFFCLLIMLFGIFSPNTLAATLHAILVADTNDSKIGRSTMTDLSNMHNLMKSVKENTGLALNVKTLQGSTITSTGQGYEKVTQAVKQLSVNRQDIVVFYYSGHGGRLSSDKSKWPSLAVEGQTTRSNRLIPLTDIIALLKQKNPKFFIVIADSCNSIIDTERFLPKPAGQKLEAYQKLFLGYKGYLIASASKPRQYAFGDPQNGGLFSQALHASLNKALISSQPTWKDIMDQATKPIQTNSPLQSVQNPQADYRHAISVKVDVDSINEDNLGSCKSAEECAGAVGGVTNICAGRGTCKTGDYFNRNGQECCCENGQAHCFE
jgi:hypothetical protein